MALRHRRVAGRTVAAFAAVVAGFALTALPAYATEPSPSDSPSPDPAPSASSSQDPSPQPSASTDPVPSSPAAPGPGDPGGGTGSPGDPSPGESPPPESAPADLAVAVPGPKVTVGAKEKWVRVDVDNYGGGVAKNVAVTLDFSDVAETVTIDQPGADQDCTIDGTTSVCAYPDLDPGDVDTFVTFTVTPADGAKPGPAGTVHVSVTADNPELNPADNSADVPLELVDSDSDLVAFAGQVGPVKPGKQDILWFGFVNQGDRPVAGFRVEIELPEYATVVERYDGCTYSGGGHHVACDASDFAIGPDESCDLSGIFHIAVSRHAPGPVVLGRGTFSVTELDASSGAHAAAVEVCASESSVRAADASPGDNVVRFPVKTAANPSDLAISAAHAEGKPGDKVRVRFTVTNRGPADLRSFHLVLTAPTGADLVGYPSNGQLNCTDEYGGHLDVRGAECTYLSGLPSGASRSFTMPFRIVGDDVGDDGRATVSHSNPGGDPNRKNNTAVIVIGPPGSTGGGTGGGGGLPVTGTGLAGLIAGGAMALLLGVALVLVVRWRRTPVSVG